jgi:hypothetical protein
MLFLFLHACILTLKVMLLHHSTKHALISPHTITRYVSQPSTNLYHASTYTSTCTSACTVYHNKCINHAPKLYQTVHQPCTTTVPNHAQTMHHNYTTPCINHAPHLYQKVHQLYTTTCIINLYVSIMYHIMYHSCINTCTMYHIPCTIPSSNHEPTMHINHVHQHHTIYHNISSMKCLNHMPRICAKYVPSIYQYHQQVSLSMYQYHQEMHLIHVPIIFLTPCASSMCQKP